MCFRFQQVMWVSYNTLNSDAIIHLMSIVYIQNILLLGKSQILLVGMKSFAALMENGRMISQNTENRADIQLSNLRSDTQRK